MSRVITQTVHCSSMTLTGDDAAAFFKAMTTQHTAAQAEPVVASDVQKDAERYRWLRAQNWNDSSLCVVERPKKSVKLGFDCPSLQRLDDAIDAARAQGVQP